VSVDANRIGIVALATLRSRGASFVRVMEPIDASPLDAHRRRDRRRGDSAGRRALVRNTFDLADPPGRFLPVIQRSITQSRRAPGK
jgi:hypothetical protein